jgi:Dolichyl-phosphate-mannose-protein mannosyltransferase
MENRGYEAEVLAWIPRCKIGVTSFANYVAESLHRYQYPFLILFSVIYFPVTCFLASRKLFWFDEIFSVYISRLPDMAAVWGELNRGTDITPPLFYVLMRLSYSLFGDSQVTSRLPEMIGFWILCVCLFRFVSIRTSALAGAIAMLLPLVTTAYYYAYDARPHGIGLGFAGIALVCWQAAIRSNRRIFWLIGLFLALSCAILNHTYSVLLVFPLALAEFVRALLLKRVDWTVCLAICAPLLGLLPSIVIWQTTSKVYPGFMQSKVTYLMDSYQFLLGPAVLVLATGLLFYFAFEFGWPNSKTTDEKIRWIDLPEVIAIIGFSLLPAVAYFVATLTGAPLFPRYVLSTVIGFCCLFGMLMAKRSEVGLGVLLVLTAQIGASLYGYMKAHTVIEPNSLAVLSTRAYEFDSKYREIGAAMSKNLPIVLLEKLESLPIMHYAPGDLARSLVFVSNNNDNVFVLYNLLQQHCGAPGRAQLRPDFLAANREFLVYITADGTKYLRHFLPKNADVRMSALPSGGFLYAVTLAKSQDELEKSALH